MPKDAEGAKAEARRKRYGKALLAAIALFQAHASTLLTSLAHGEITASAWAAAYVDVLVDLHAQAYYAGRGVAATITGDEPPAFGLAERVYGTAVAATQAPYVADFREAIEQGKYDDPESGEFDPGRCAWRVDLYADRAHGTAHEGLQRSLDSDAEIDWCLGGNEDHCESCPAWSANGPYTRLTLPAVPGDGKSECGTHCLCYLRVNGIAVPMLARPGAYVA